MTTYYNRLFVGGGCYFLFCPCSHPTLFFIMGECRGDGLARLLTGVSAECDLFAGYSIFGCVTVSTTPRG